MDGNGGGGVSSSKSPHPPPRPGRAFPNGRRGGDPARRRRRRRAGSGVPRRRRAARAIRAGHELPCARRQLRAQNFPPTHTLHPPLPGAGLPCRGAERTRKLSPSPRRRLFARPCMGCAVTRAGGRAGSGGGRAKPACAAPEWPAGGGGAHRAAGSGGMGGAGAAVLRLLWGVGFSGGGRVGDVRGWRARLPFEAAVKVAHASRSKVPSESL